MFSILLTALSIKIWFLIIAIVLIFMIALNLRIFVDLVLVILFIIHAFREVYLLGYQFIAH
jgi:hypothetical protein